MTRLEAQLRESLCIIPSDGHVILDGVDCYIPADYVLDEVQRELCEMLERKRG